MIVSVGSIVPRKAFNVLVEALAGLAAEEARWVARRAVRHRSMGVDAEDDDLDGSFEFARRAIAEPNLRTDTCGVVFVVPAQ